VRHPRHMVLVPARWGLAVLARHLGVYVLGDIVPDSFCGFGSTLLLAKIPGRRYVDLALDVADWRTARARFTPRSLERFRASGCSSLSIKRRPSKSW